MWSEICIDSKESLKLFVAQIGYILENKTRTKNY